MLAALKACRAANRGRSQVIHDTWPARPGSMMVTLHGGRKSHDVMIMAQTPGEVRHVAEHVIGTAHDLRTAMATGPGR